MRKLYRLLGLGLLIGLSLLAGCGGGGGGESSTPTRVGSATCTEACHATTKDITGTQIAAAWAGNPHTSNGTSTALSRPAQRRSNAAVAAH